MRETPRNDESSSIGIFSNFAADEAKAARLAILMVAATITLPDDTFKSMSMSIS